MMSEKEIRDGFDLLQLSFNTKNECSKELPFEKLSFLEAVPAKSLNSSSDLKSSFHCLIVSNN